MNFAICDDDPVFCDSLSDMLKDFFRLNQIRGQSITTFQSGEDLLQHPEPFDIIFMDVEMPGLSGIHTGQRIKKKYPRTMFLIITSYDTYIDEAFKFHAFRYITKPLSKLRFFNNVRDAIKEYNSINEKYIIETKDGSYTIFASDIIFLESTGKNTDVYTTEKIFYSVHSITYWQEQIDNPCFYQTNKSYIVNMHYINRFTMDTIFLCDSLYKARLTRRRYTEFKNTYALFLESST